MRRKRERNRGKSRFIVLIMLLSLIIGGFYILDEAAAPLTNKKDYVFENEIKNEEKNEDLLNVDALIGIEPTIYSANAILMNAANNEILFDKGSEERIYPASLTKIMTTIIAIENIPNLQQKIRLQANMFQELYAANASMAGFKPNEEVPAFDLLYGTMLPSGAETAVGLAMAVSGSEKKFVDLMNEKAMELNMSNTHFMNVTGLHHDDHYSTVKDIAILLTYALQNETFRTIFTASRHSTAPTNLHPEGITFHSSMFQEMDTTEFNGGKIIGGKTGYTEKAGLCLASLSKKNNQEYILVTAGAAGNRQTEPFHILDAFKVYNESF
ncbi:D-alanyl-D-alanine carboxypeptidase family protein [Bacillus sp. Bva_UNVM-123]|uniref:D-alanyl-D-alanine carboxypeptidase family protein n=1 Tax=Bacillus sp. Bva_UNVM-123 TaxID=2829798 RepID=UPI00391F19CE